MSLKDTEGFLRARLEMYPNIYRRINHILKNIVSLTHFLKEVTEKAIVKMSFSLKNPITNQ